MMKRGEMKLWSQHNGLKSLGKISSTFKMKKIISALIAGLGASRLCTRKFHGTGFLGRSITLGGAGGT